MQITDNAINQVAGMITGDESLRVYISGGGCSGFNYGFKLDENTIDGDYEIERNGVKVLVDPMSYQYLQGIAIDYVQDLMGSRFQVSNPNAKTTCGCGSSFSV
jgi:iron-sulfur cluster insertion protein